MGQGGIVLYHGIESGQQLSEYARLAERAGFDSLWVTERYFHEETFSLLGFLAAKTQRIKLGLGVANPYTRNPALLAMAAATLDRICGGRFLLGLGRSDRPLIEGRLGIPYGEPRSTLRESVVLIRDLLGGQVVNSSDGRFQMVDVGLAIRPVQERVPIYLAAIGPRALRLAGAVADGVLLNAYVSAAYVRYAVSVVRQAARDSGRDPSSVSIACMLVVRLSDDPERIWPGLKERMARLLAEPHVGEVLLERGGFDPSLLGPLRRAAVRGQGDATSLISDEIVESTYVVGPAARCRERVEEYREAGVDHPLLLPGLEDFSMVAESLGPRVGDSSLPC